MVQSGHDRAWPSGAHILLPFPLSLHRFFFVCSRLRRDFVGPVVLFVPSVVSLSRQSCSSCQSFSLLPLFSFAECKRLNK